MAFVSPCPPLLGGAHCWLGPLVFPGCSGVCCRPACPQPAGDLSAGGEPPLAPRLPPGASMPVPRSPASSPAGSCTTWCHMGGRGGAHAVWDVNAAVSKETGSSPDAAVKIGSWAARLPPPLPSREVMQQPRGEGRARDKDRPAAFLAEGWKDTNASSREEARVSHWICHSRFNAPR